MDHVHDEEAVRWGGWHWQPKGYYPETGPYRTCSYCGSIHPDDITDGCDLHLSDMKYGWPHKAYGNYPNPEPEKLFVIASSNSKPDTMRDFGYQWYPVTAVPEGIIWEPWDGCKWVGVGKRPMLHFKLYTIHLRDPELDGANHDRIFRRLGIRLEFGPLDGRPGVSWERYA